MPRAISKVTTHARGLHAQRKPQPSGARAAWDVDGAYSVAEVSARLSVSTKTVRRLLKAGTLQHVKIGRRVVVTASSVAALLERAR